MILLLALPASADIGPPPTCPAGTHSEYLQGRHCVKDGFHMELGPNGPVEVADGAAPPTPPTPETPAPATDPAPAPSIPEVTPGPPAPTPAPAESKRCETSSGAAGWLGMLAAFALAVRRR